MRQVFSLSEMNAVPSQLSPACRELSFQWRFWNKPFSSGFWPHVFPSHSLSQRRALIKALLLRGGGSEAMAGFSFRRTEGVRPQKEMENEGSWSCFVI